MTAVGQGESDEMRGEGPILEVVEVVKRYGAGPTEVRALTDVSLSVQPGEMVAVMGPSGCGKSTLLHLAGGLEPPTAGRVLVDSTDLAALSAAGLARLRRTKIAFVFQKLNLLVGLTAIENVMLPLELDGSSRRAARAEAEDALGAVGLPRPWDRYPDDVSGGQQQQIAIARAMVGGRGLLLADEPTGALDTTSAEDVIDLLARACSSRGIAVVLVTHEARFASWADRVVFLRDGRIVDEARGFEPMTVTPRSVDA